MSVLPPPQQLAPPQQIYIYIYLCNLRECDTTIAGAVAPGPNTFVAYIKNSVAESHGARGYYMEFTLSNALTVPVELYSVGSSVMKSYP